MENISKMWVLLLYTALVLVRCSDAGAAAWPTLAPSLHHGLGGLVFQYIGALVVVSNFAQQFISKFIYISRDLKVEPTCEAISVTNLKSFACIQT